jgi:L-ascorbate metabolism protein UlaG (beta-lactamase superfamily)
VPADGRWSRIAAVVAAGSVSACAAVNPDFDPTRPHHRPDGFVNRYGPPGGKPFAEFVRWQRERARDGLPKPPSTHMAGYDGFPVVRPDLDRLHANARGPEITVTWIGHATVFVQIGGLNLLFDPVFSDRASPLAFAGPPRRVPLPVRLDELPRIDLVLISHNHYDHLDRATVRMLLAQPGGAPRFLAPLGVDRWLREAGATQVDRFDWWDGLVVEGLQVDFTPAQHWSSRTPWDRNATLWGGFVVRVPGFSFWFSGDTGYSPDFRDIAERFGGFDLAAIPVGSYEPRWFMAEQHVNPAEAVQVFLDVKAREAIGVHWGTFELTDEPLDAPIGDLAQALDARGVPRERFALWRHGETRRYRVRAASADPVRAVHHR